MSSSRKLVSYELGIVGVNTDLCNSCNEDSHLYGPGLHLVLAGREEVHQLQILVSRHNDLVESTEMAFTRYSLYYLTIINQYAHVSFLHRLFVYLVLNFHGFINIL